VPEATSTPNLNDPQARDALRYSPGWLSSTSRDTPRLRSETFARIMPALPSALGLPRGKRGPSARRRYYGVGVAAEEEATSYPSPEEVCRCYARSRKPARSLAVVFRTVRQPSRSLATLSRDRRRRSRSPHGRARRRQMRLREAMSRFRRALLGCLLGHPQPGPPSPRRQSESCSWTFSP
jgi:hypothetical protein